MSMLLIRRPNNVPHQSKPLHAHCHLVQIGGRVAHVASDHNGSGNTRETLHSKPIPYSSYIEDRGASLRLESLYILIIDWGRCYRLVK